MYVDLSEREIDLLLRMLSESLRKVNKGKDEFDLSMDEVPLLEKLENSLRFNDFDRMLTERLLSKVSYLN